MKNIARKIAGAGALAIVSIVGAERTASASTYYQTTDFNTSNMSSNAQNDFIDNLQLGTAPTDHANAPTYNGGSVTLEGTSNESAVLGLIDSGTNNAGVYTDTDAVVDFSLANGSGGNSLYDTFGLGERLTGAGTNGALTSKANNYPAYLVYYDLGTLTLAQEQGYTNSYGTALDAQSGITLPIGDAYQLEMTVTGSTSPALTAVLTDTTTNTVLADLTSTGSITDAQGSVAFYGGSDGNGNYNIEHGITATSFSVNASSAAMPEPSALGLIALGGLGLLLPRRRRAM